MHRSGHSQLFRQIRRTFHAARMANRGLAVQSRSGISRRRFLAGATATVMAAYTGIGRAQAFRRPPRIAVVGGGIAGLNATYLLSKAGFPVTLYEASNHTGGRIQTNHGSVARNVYTELGGEFIDSGHEDMLGLAQLFGFDLIDTQADSEQDLEVAYYGGGKLRSEEEVIAAFGPLAAIIDRDVEQTSDEITYDSHSKFDARLDRTDLRTYFNRNIKTDWLYEILEAGYVNEFGLNLEDQSSLNFVWTIGTDTTDGFAIYGESDQRYKVRGGNQQIVDALAAEVADRIQLQSWLTGLTRLASGAYQLAFAQNFGPDRTAQADIVILCLPFSILRNLKLQLPLPAIKRKAIQELGYGINAKLILGFNSRVWRHEGFSGDSYVGLPYQSGWDSSRQQGGSRGAYTIYPGGTQASDLRAGTADSQARRLLPGLNSVFPGAQAQWNGKSLRADWPSNPYVRASYASYLTGQWTSIRGAEGTPVGNLYFAGEHTSLDFQGYMNGGAQSGRLVAEALIAGAYSRAAS
jgi:monoamine oxidase